jgi:hypothetical protein
MRGYFQIKSAKRSLSTVNLARLRSFSWTRAPSSCRSMWKNPFWLTVANSTSACGPCWLTRYTYISSVRGTSAHQLKYFRRKTSVTISSIWQTTLSKNTVKITVSFKMVISFLSGLCQSLCHRSRWNSFGVELKRLLIWLSVLSRKR